MVLGFSHIGASVARGQAMTRLAIKVSWSGEVRDERCKIFQVARNIE